MSRTTKDLNSVLRNEFLWFAGILMLICGILVASFFSFNVSGRVREERAWLESYSQSFLKDLQLGDVASVEAKMKRFVQRHGYERVAIEFGKTTISVPGGVSKKPTVLESQLSNLYTRLAEAPSVAIDLRDPVGTFFGTMTVRYFPHEFYRPTISSLLVILATFLSLLLVLTGLYVKRVTDLEEPFLSLFTSLKRMKQATEEGVGSVEDRLETSLVRTGISEMDSLQREFASTLASIVRLQEKVNDAKVAKAIAGMTQMFAHDVRKPFSMFKSIIQIVEGTNEPRDVSEVLKLTLPEVNQAMASVEGMISDVMQIGGEMQMHMEDASPYTLVEAALVDLVRVCPEADMSITYSFSHRHMVNVDPLRMGRVFANILVNAAQATRQLGNLWFQTTEQNGYVEFTVGNTGSFIPEETLPRLFDAFFTSGKKGGTGLGLAIAKKIVEAHGGSIRCFSERNEAYPAGKVEFRFTLPRSHHLCSPGTAPLPQSTRTLKDTFLASRVTIAQSERAASDPRETELEAAILSRLDRMNGRGGRKVTVLAVEDEIVYQNGLHSLIARSPELSARVRMVFARGDTEALSVVDQTHPVLVIEDVDLGPASKNGIEIVRVLRERGFKGHICVHSNRFLLEDNKAATAAGADSVLPKPMGRAHFLKLLLASLPPEPVGEPRSTSTPKLSVAMLDDSVSMRMAWKMELEDETRFRSFGRTDEFLDHCERDPLYFSSLDVVISDFNFSPDDPHDGGTLARELRARGFQGLILKASGETDLGAETEALFDGDVGKSALEWPEFKEAVQSARKKRSLG